VIEDYQTTDIRLQLFQDDIECFSISWPLLSTFLIAAVQDLQNLSPNEGVVMTECSSHIALKHLLNRWPSYIYFIYLSSLIMNPHVETSLFEAEVILLF
jgi:hypothetical protein